MDKKSSAVEKSEKEGKICKEDKNKAAWKFFSKNTSTLHAKRANRKSRLEI
jgi:hypothetical protein